jgi:hypothetical protein
MKYAIEILEWNIARLEADKVHVKYHTPFTNYGKTKKEKTQSLNRKIEELEKAVKILKAIK